MPNRLAHATSPYLLQHAANPVDWHEWGEEAFTEAARRQCPVLLSVGYAACHWCHVMAHESFEDPATAALMNERFVNVKVDREERPDVDRIYMDAVQAMTGHGGWPMTVFLLPSGEPFLAGTYFPAEPRRGLPSFRQVLEGVAAAWDTQRPELAGQGRRIAKAIAAGLPSGEAPPIEEAIATAVERLGQTHDPVHGGFGGAPKFPQAPVLELLLRVAALDRPTGLAGAAAALLEATLDGMAAGGIYDHLGGGFARYSVDAAWQIPHFEKMLTDNALLARIYLRASQVTGDPARRATYRRVAIETLDYLMRDMTDPHGGLSSSQDADSEGVEGKYYIWTWDELGEVLGDDQAIVAALYGATPAGNFEGANILHRAAAPEKVAADLGITPAAVLAVADRAGAALRSVRSRRVRPATDDKVVAAWNGLALRAFAEAGAILPSDRYLAQAIGIAEFATTILRRADGRLLRSWRHGAAGGPGFCDDYGALAVGLFTLYQATGDKRWFHEGERLTRDLIDLFADGDHGFHATGSDAAPLIARPKNLMDGATPSDNSLAAEAVQILTAYTGDAALTGLLDGIAAAAALLLERHPTAVGGLLGVLAVATEVKEVAIVGAAAEREPLTAVLWESFRPDCVLATHSPGEPTRIPLLAGRNLHDGAAAAHVCRHFACRLPVTTPEALRAELDG